MEPEGLPCQFNKEKSELGIQGELPPAVRVLIPDNRDNDSQRSTLALSEKRKIGITANTRNILFPIGQINPDIQFHQKTLQLA